MNTLYKYLALYFVLIVIFVFYIKQQTYPTIEHTVTNTKRNAAIEQFRNYETNVINQLRNKCKQTPDSTPNKPSELMQFINESFNGIIPVSILNNYTANLDRRIEIATDDMFQMLDTIYRGSTPTTENGTKSAIETWLYTRFPRLITDFRDEQLLSDLDRLINTSSITIEDNNIDTPNARRILINAKFRVGVLEPLTKEFKNKLSTRFQNEYQQVYENVCDSLPAPIDEMARIPVNLDTSRQRLLLYILVALATTKANQARLKEQYDVLSKNMIQPLASRDISDMSMLSDIITTSMPVNELQSYGNNGIAAAKELDMAEMYAKSYQDYLAAQQKHEIASAIDPIKALDMLESTIINKAESFSNRGGIATSGATSRPCKNTRICGATNRFGTQANHRGTYLGLQSNTTNMDSNNIGVGDPIIHPSVLIRKQQRNNSKNNDVIEGFATDEENTSQLQLDTILEKMPGFASYAITTARSIIGEDMVNNLVKTLNSDNNMIPIGILIIMLSIVLFFIDVSS